MLRELQGGPTIAVGTMAAGTCGVRYRSSCRSLGEVKGAIAESLGINVAQLVLFEHGSEHALPDSTDIPETVFAVVSVCSRWDVRTVGSSSAKYTFADNNTTVTAESQCCQQFVSDEPFCAAVNATFSWKLTIKDKQDESKGMHFGLAELAIKHPRNRAVFVDHPSNRRSDGPHRLGVYFWDAYGRWLWHCCGQDSGTQDCMRCHGPAGNTTPKTGDVVCVTSSADGRYSATLNGVAILSTGDADRMGVVKVGGQYCLIVSIERGAAIQLC
jgi:hypothetical protein